MDALVDQEDFLWLYNSHPSGVPPISTMSRPRDASQTLWTLRDIPVNEEPILRLASRAQLGGDDIPISYTHFRPKTIAVVAAPDRVPGAESYLQGISQRFRALRLLFYVSFLGMEQRSHHEQHSDFVRLW